MLLMMTLATGWARIAYARRTLTLTLTHSLTLIHSFTFTLTVHSSVTFWLCWTLFCTDCIVLYCVYLCCISIVLHRMSVYCIVSIPFIGIYATASRYFLKFGLLECAFLCACIFTSTLQNVLVIMHPLRRAPLCSVTVKCMHNTSKNWFIWLR